MNKKIFKRALKEAAEWDKEATEWEKNDIPFSEARKRVLERIFDRYYDSD